MRRRRLVAVGIVLLVCASGLWTTPAVGDRESSSVRAFQHGLLGAGYRNACAVVTTGKVRCWGYGGFGRLGHDSTSNVGDGVGPSIGTAGDLALGGDAVAVSGGGAHSCALLTTGKVRCWGRGDEGQLGHDSGATIGDGVGQSIIAAGDVPVGADAVAVTAGGGHTCALLTTGKVRCWGRGVEGQLGHDNGFDVGSGFASIITAGDVPVGGDVAAISAGDDFTCALLTTGKVRCWGLASFGRLGHGSTSNVGDGVGPSIISAGDVPIGGDAVAISAGGAHACALLTTGKVRCWGRGSSGELGHGSTANVGDGVGPSIITAGDVPIGGDVVAIAAGFSSTCALLTTGKVRCWGLGQYGRLGYGSTSNVGNGVGPSIVSAGDVPLGGDAVTVSVGDSYSCALLTTGKVRCWGAGADGRLGYGSSSNVADGVGPSIVTAGDVPIGVDLFGQAADVSLAAAPAGVSAPPGQQATVTLTATNAGPDTATGIAVSAPLPAGLTLASATPTQGTYAAGTWTLGSLAPGASASLALVVSAAAAGTRTLVADVSSGAVKDPDSTPGNAVATEDDYRTATITTTTVPTTAPATETCTVPKLKGVGLAAAVKKLQTAHCKLGKVHRPPGRVPAGQKLVVRSSTPAAGTTAPTGTKVDLKLKRVSRH